MRPRRIPKWWWRWVLAERAAESSARTMPVWEAWTRWFRWMYMCPAARRGRKRCCTAFCWRLGGWGKSGQAKAFPTKPADSPGGGACFSLPSEYELLDRQINRRPRDRHRRRYPAHRNGDGLIPRSEPRRHQNDHLVLSDKARRQARKQGCDLLSADGNRHRTGGVREQRQGCWVAAGRLVGYRAEPVTVELEVFSGGRRVAGGDDGAGGVIHGVGHRAAVHQKRRRVVVQRDVHQVGVQELLKRHFKLRGRVVFQLPRHIHVHLARADEKHISRHALGRQAAGGRRIEAHRNAIQRQRQPREERYVAGRVQ